MLLKSMVTSYFFAVLVTRNSEVKRLSFPMSRNFKTVAEPCLRPSVAEPSPQRLVFEHRSFYVAFVMQKNGTGWGFSQGTFHTPVSTLTLVLHTYTMTTTDAV